MTEEIWKELVNEIAEYYGTTVQIYLRSFK
jgi:hypothetical protein